MKFFLLRYVLLLLCMGPVSELYTMETKTGYDIFGVTPTPGETKDSFKKTRTKFAARFHVDKFSAPLNALQNRLTTEFPSLSARLTVSDISIYTVKMLQEDFSKKGLPVAKLPFLLANFAIYKKAIDFYNARFRFLFDFSFYLLPNEFYWTALDPGVKIISEVDAKAMADPLRAADYIPEPDLIGQPVKFQNNPQAKTEAESETPEPSPARPSRAPTSPALFEPLLAILEHHIKKIDPEKYGMYELYTKKNSPITTPLAWEGVVDMAVEIFQKNATSRTKDPLVERHLPKFYRLIDTLITKVFGQKGCEFNDFAREEIFELHNGEYFYFYEKLAPEILRKAVDYLKNWYSGTIACPEDFEKIYNTLHSFSPKYVIFFYYKPSYGMSQMYGALLTKILPTLSKKAFEEELSRFIRVYNCAREGIINEEKKLAAVTLKLETSPSEEDQKQLAAWQAKVTVKRTRFKKEMKDLDEWQEILERCDFKHYGKALGIAEDECTRMIKAEKDKQSLIPEPEQNLRRLKGDKSPVGPLIKALNVLKIKLDALHKILTK